MVTPEQKSAVDAALRADPSMSNREIARQTGTEPGTVARTRLRLESEGIIGPSHVRVGRDGRRHPGSAGPVVVRRPGDLPDRGLGELLGDGIAVILSSAERRRRRRVVNFLKRLSTPLLDFEEFAHAPGEIGSAVIEVVGRTRADELANVLGRASQRLHAIALAIKTEVTGERA